MTRIEEHVSTRSCEAYVYDCYDYDPYVVSGNQSKTCLARSIFGVAVVLLLLARVKNC